MPTPKQSSEDRTRSTESFGQGQSGYTAGRVEADPALQHQSRNVSHADGRDAHPHQLNTDERFSGGGGAPWVPEEQDEPTGRYERVEHAERDEHEGRAKSAKSTERAPGGEPAERESRAGTGQKRS